MASELPSDAPTPRLCHLVKWPDFDGYGFNLHAEKAKSGQFIGKVDDDSPADHAGLREGDRIIEVNGVNIANENHRQVVERIKAVPNETKLLVLDNDADKWYKERKIVVKNSLPNVNYMKTPVPRPTENKAEQKAKPTVENNVSSQTVQSNGNASPNHSETRSLADSSRSSTPKTEPKQESPPTTPADSPAPAHAPKAQNGSAEHNNNNDDTSSKSSLNVPNGVSLAATPPPASRMMHPQTKPESKSTTDGGAKAVPATNGSSKAPLDSSKSPAPGKAGGSGELNLNMSAAQMREMLANKKKNDPKKQTMDMREKYQIVQGM